MKIFLLISFLFIGVGASAQTPAEQLATKIAQKMKDSLVLTQTQYDQLYSINMNLHQRKQAVFARYTASDSIRVYLQRIENKRDTLYSTVLPADKYLLYKQKKLELVYTN